jgi:flagellar biosynthesis GTPase FlhF
MLMIIGPTGCGKTSTFKKQERSDIFVVECKKYKSSAKQFFKQLAGAMKLKTGGNTEQLIESIIEKICLPYF